MAEKELMWWWGGLASKQEVIGSYQAVSEILKTVTEPSAPSLLLEVLIRNQKSKSADKTEDMEKKRDTDVENRR